MAPQPPLGRTRAMALVAERKIPIHFGTPHPHVAIVAQEGRYRIRALVVDAAEADAARREAMAKKGMWMPEHHYALAKPTGEIFVDAETIDALLAAMTAMDWPRDW